MAAAQHWGLADTLVRCNGMFGLALWDRQERTLQLARDRFGEKPLYYGWSGKAFLFGSELKALRAHPAFDGAVDRDALALYFRHNCVPAPYSIHGAVAKLPPATILTVDLADGPGDLPRPRAVLVPGRHRLGRRLAPPGARRGRRPGHPRHRARGCGRHAHARRCRPGGVSVRGHRLVARRGAHAGAARRQGEDLHHRLRGRACTTRRLRRAPWPGTSAPSTTSSSSRPETPWT